MNIWTDAFKMQAGETKMVFPTNNSVERLTRVPGGWIYTYGDMHGVTTTLIPLPNFRDETFKPL
jgi:hypothetical protein